MKIYDVWKFVIGISFAKSYIWSAKDHDYERTYLFSLHIVSRNKMRGLCFVIFPLSIIIGYNK